MTAAPSAALVRVLALLCGWAVTDVAHAADDPPPTDATWQDPLRELRLAARGSLGVCELLTLPVAWIPGVGDAASIVVELACIVPAVVAVDHVAVLHTHLHQSPDLARADAIDTVMTTAGGGLQAVGHTALLSGLALMGGAVGQWWLYRQDARLAEGLAWAGLWSAAAGGVLLGAGQVTWLSRGLVLPIAFWAAEPAAESVAAE